VIWTAFITKRHNTSPVYGIVAEQRGEFISPVPSWLDFAKEGW
jgi:hypothetical protein